MRIVVAAAVCAALFGADPVLGATGEREQLLETLARVYPAGFKALPVGPALTSVLRDRLMDGNPGRDDAIDPIVAAHARCVTRLLDNIDFGTPMAAAVRASSLSDEDLRTVVSIYSDPDVDALLGKLTVDPPHKPTDSDVALVARLVARASDPARKRFNEVVSNSPEMRPVQTQFVDGIEGCEMSATEAAGRAGLKSSKGSGS